MHAIGFPVIDRDPIGIKLGRAIGAAGLERGRLGLRAIGGVAVKLGRRGLIETHPILKTEDAYSLKQPKRPQAIGVGRVLRRFEADLYVALRCQIVYLCGPGLLDQSDQIGRVRHIAIVQEKAGVVVVRIDVEVIQARGVERRRAALDAMHDVALVQQELGKIGSVLAGYAGYEGNLFSHFTYTKCVRRWFPVPLR